MKSLEQERLDAEQAHQKKLQELESKHGVLSALPEEVTSAYEPPFIHHYKLYGAEGTINFSTQRYSSLKGPGKDPDRELMKKLIVAFPPVVRFKIRERGTTSFRPAVPPDNKVHSNPEWVTESERVAPIVVRLSLGGSLEAIYEWYSMVPGLGLWQFQIRFPMYATDGLGQLRLERGGSPQLPVEHRPVRVCEFTPVAPAKRMKWGSAGPTYPNDFTIYWPGDVTWQNIIATIKEQEH